MKINVGQYQSYSFYLISYSDTIRFLYDKIEKREISPEKSIMPFMFMIRHFLEIGYKGNINYLSKYSQLKGCVNYYKHPLQPLHKALKDHFNKTVDNFSLDKDRIQEFNKLYDELGELTIFFDTIDNKAISFRYPIDTKNNPVFKADETIDIIEIYVTFEKTKNLLIYLTDLLLKNVESFKDDINWVLAGGLWNDDGVWDDSKLWNNGI